MKTIISWVVFMVTFELSAYTQNWEHFTVDTTGIAQ